MDSQFTLLIPRILGICCIRFVNCALVILREAGGNQYFWRNGFQEIGYNKWIRYHESLTSMVTDGTQFLHGFEQISGF